MKSRMIPNSDVKRNMENIKHRLTEQKQIELD